MVVSVVRGPPNRTLLSRGCSEECQHKLKEATRLVRPVREVAVVYTRYGKHSDHIERHAHRECRPTKSDHEYQEAPKMDRPEC